MEQSELIQQALRELDIPVPRRLGLRSPSDCKSLWGRILVVSLFFIPFFAIIIFVLLPPFLAHFFGLPTQANLLDMWVRRGKGYSYHIRVEYADGVQREVGDITISSGVYNALQRGQRVDIHYFPVFHSSPSLDLSPPGFIQLIPFVFILIFPVMMVFQAKKQKRLIAIGKSIKGRVISRGPKVITAKYDFDGKEYTASGGSFLYRSRSNDTDEVVILADPDKPQTSFIYDPSNCLWVPIKDLLG